MQKWEYMILSGSYRSIELKINEINSLGKDGWELVSATVNSGNKHELFFKRPIN